MAFKFVAFATLLALASAGLAPTYPAASYQHGYPAQGSYPGHSAYSAAAPVPAYGVAKIAAPVYSAPVYPAPVAKIAAPVYASPIAKAAPVYSNAAPEPYNSHPQYNFAYDVHDEHTGDVKSQQETRDGDVVKGYYSFIESDGARRVVEYTSDPEHGFNAVVRREQGAAHPTGPSAAPQAYAKAPVYQKVAAPVYQAPVANYGAPVAKYAAPVYAAPVANYAAPVAKIATPVYAAPVANYAAPVAKYAAPVYAAPAAKVAYPAYHH